MLVSFIIPVYNPGSDIQTTIEYIKKYGEEFNNEVEIIIVDSDSTDGSTKVLEYDPEIRFFKIKKELFDHGGTRNSMFQHSKGQFVFFLTQDAIPTGTESFANLLKNIIAHPSIGMAYGRQLPKENADFFGRFARLFNYPDKSLIKSWNDRERLGIKTVFVSNSFAVYRRSALKMVGGFPDNVILSEDTCAAARMVEHGWSIAYEADACVYHSHNFTPMQEFRRYFDIGVFYGREKWILEDFSTAEGEGKRFVSSQIRQIFKCRKLGLIPQFFIRNMLKYLGYKLGQIETHIPYFLKKRISTNQHFWNNERQETGNYIIGSESEKKARKLS